MAKAVLVTGATGKQGGAVIQALLDSKSQNTTIIAVTRTTASKSAQALQAKGVTVVQGDLDDPSAIFAQTGPVHGVFSIQAASPGSPTEEIQGKALIDAAVAHGVSHFVYTSGDRGGPKKSPHNPTFVGNLIAKHNVEKHLEKEAAASPQHMTYTILRPTTFFDNLSQDRHGAGFARLWEQIGERKLQLVSTKDIGWFGAQALLHPEEYEGVALSLAGDEMTQTEAARVFREVVGKEMPIAPCVVGKGLKFFLKETLGTMFQWLKEEGYGADVEECRRRKSDMQDLKAWLRESSGYLETS